ncbi:hypothetical protein F0L68_28925 [Solihabitans fulvus]|uniref:Uncharacterized protein n=1 Tax=Solihabitans fulvus TaxID=1892852 RepID=A0A5B2WUN6_9PSEU|nr:hypothetical protein [Solihabitans fulvus]KAA2255245.1 hypothetical protein F0L68_28925 [Solihabitans fulvus]
MGVEDVVEGSVTAVEDAVALGTRDKAESPAAQVAENRIPAPADRTRATRVHASPADVARVLRQRRVEHS